MITKRKSESGQVVVFLVVVLVALLGFSALAIDGGMIYADRRLVQTAADAAAMAGVGVAAEKMDDLGVNSGNFVCSSSKVTTSMSAAEVQAISRALANDFSIDADISDNMGVEVTCHIEDKGPWIDKYLDVKVILNMDTRTTFAHIFMGTGSVTNTVEAVARVRPRSPLAFGNAIVSTGTGCDSGNGGIVYNGGGTDFVSVTGGGIYSSSCMVMNGGVDLSTHCDEVLFPGCTDEPGIYYGTTYDQQGTSGSIVPGPQFTDVDLPPMNVPVPDCSDPKAIQHNSQIKLAGNDSMTLAPGLHCIYDGIMANTGTLIGDDVTLYIIGGDVDINGNVEVHLSAPNGDDVDNDGDGTVDEASEDLPAIRGILMYVAPTGGSITINGTNTSYYVGTIYAPTSEIVVGGNASALKTVSTQLIGQQVTLNGGVTVDIRFVEEDNYPVLPKMELAK
ncbi:MAG: hypothetical protein JW987_17135 [Anaerolineaceae bacterium]|nr:hypothetical protein [Anaerolineaceae bacterium]